MSASVKETYIKAVLSRIDNLFLRRRLRTELEAHFDDAMATLSLTEHSISKVISDMGDPAEIAESANQGNPAVLHFIKNTLNQSKVALLVMILCLMGLGLFQLSNQLNQAQVLVDHLSNQIDTLNSKVKQIDTLRGDLTKLQNGNELVYLLSNQINAGSVPFKPVSVSTQLVSDYTVSTYTPIGLPLTVKYFKAVPAQIAIEENFGSLRFVYRSGNISKIFSTIELMSRYQVVKLRGLDSFGQLKLINGDVDLNNGFYLVINKPILDGSSGLNSDQIQTIQDFLKLVKAYSSNDYPFSFNF